MAAFGAITIAGSVETINGATVNNGDKINWIILEENVLRERVTTDVATQSGQFDVITISNYETPM